MREEMMKREKWVALNRQINQQLRAAGVLDQKGRIVKPFETLPASEWKNWMLELISERNKNN